MFQLAKFVEHNSIVILKNDRMKKPYRVFRHKNTFALDVIGDDGEIHRQRLRKSDVETIEMEVIVSPKDAAYAALSQATKRFWGPDMNPSIIGDYTKKIFNL